MGVLVMHILTQKILHFIGIYYSLFVDLYAKIHPLNDLRLMKKNTKKPEV